MSWLLSLLKSFLALWAAKKAGASEQRATDLKTGEEAALNAEQERKKSDAKIDADSNAADLEWLRSHGTSASGDKPG